MSEEKKKTNIPPPLPKHLLEKRVVNEIKTMHKMDENNEENKDNSNIEDNNEESFKDEVITSYNDDTSNQFYYDENKENENNENNENKENKENKENYFVVKEEIEEEKKEEEEEEKLDGEVYKYDDIINAQVEKIQPKNEKESQNKNSSFETKKSSVIGGLLNFN
jgi:hypothetical protein